MDLHSAHYVQMPQDLSGGRMNDLIHGLTSFDPRINDPKSMREERGQIAAGQIAILVNRRGQDRAPVFTVPRRIICAASEE
jgi:hypothetical protein